MSPQEDFNAARTAFLQATKKTSLREALAPAFVGEQFKHVNKPFHVLYSTAKSLSNIFPNVETEDLTLIQHFVEDTIKTLHGSLYHACKTIDASIEIETFPQLDVTHLPKAGLIEKLAQVRSAADNLQEALQLLPVQDNDLATSVKKIIDTMPDKIRQAAIDHGSALPPDWENYFQSFKITNYFLARTAREVLQKKLNRKESVPAPLPTDLLGSMSEEARYSYLLKENPPPVKSTDRSYITAPIELISDITDNALLPFILFLAAGVMMYFFGAALLTYLATFPLLNSVASGLLTLSALELGGGTFLIPSVLLLWKRELFPSASTAAAAHAATDTNGAAGEMQPIRALCFRAAEPSPASLGSKPLSASPDAKVHKNPRPL